MDFKSRKLTLNEKKDLEKIYAESEIKAKKMGTQPGVVLEMTMKEMMKNINLDVNEETANQYRKLFKNKVEHSKSDDLVTGLLECGTRNSFDKTRSAFRFCICEKIQQLRKEADNARRIKDYDTMKAKTKEAFELSFVFDKDFLSENRIQWNDISHNKKDSASKRKTMKNADTMDDIFTRLKNNKSTYDRYAGFLSICSITGCRPAEVLKGIEIVRNRYEDGISFKILGAKVGNDRGQSERTLHFDLSKYHNNEQMNFILSQLKDNKFTYKADQKLYNSLRQYLYTQHRTFSLYTLRHRVASDLKASGADDFTIAAFLGHRVTQSQEFYGYARSSKGGIAVTGVECSDVVKANKSQFAIARTPSQISTSLKSHFKK